MPQGDLIIMPMKFANFLATLTAMGSFHSAAYRDHKISGFIGFYFLDLGVWYI